LGHLTRKNPSPI